MSWVAVAVGGSSIIGGLLGAGGAQSAARQQAAAEMASLNLQKQEFNTITGQEQPFMNAGYGALGNLNYLLGIGDSTARPGVSGAYGSLTAPFTVDTFKQMSPAYNFQAQQGRQGVFNSDESNFGALSGAANKDLSSFSQNYANTAFNNAFNQYQTQQSNIYQRLAGLATLGQNAAANTGAQGTSLAQSEGNALAGYGTALAGGTVGAANALTGGFQGLGNAAILNAYLPTTQSAINPSAGVTAPSGINFDGSGC